MGKTPKAAESAKTGPSKPAAKPSTDSIDDIFAKPKKSNVDPPSSSSKGKSKLTSSSSPKTTISTGKEKKKKKVKSVPTFDPGEESRVVEVVDPSIPVPKPAESPAVKRGKKRDRKEVEEDEMFRDSRGDGPRRRTEEGFLIFKEAELGIDPEAGGTPLCPFDCDCCF